MKWILAAGIGALALVACEEAIGPDGNASPEERAAVLAVVDESQFADEAVGVDGYSDNFAVAAFNEAYPVSASPEADIRLPLLWGRRFGGAVTRTRTVNVAKDTANVSISVQFDGTLQALIPKPGAAPDTLNRAFRHTASQKLMLVKSDSGGRRGWHLAQASPQQFVMTDTAKRTIKLTQVTVSVNNTVKIDVTDPTTLYDVNNRLPRLQRNDVVTVTARLANTANTGNAPPEFVFLHVLHADPVGLGWRRLPMVRQADGSYQKTWTVRMAGRDRLVIDAMDSQTFNPAAGEYRANVWAIPYRIEQ